jgi:RND family efflux transporter MFP subunit
VNTSLLLEKCMNGHTSTVMPSAKKQPSPRRGWIRIVALAGFAAAAIVGALYAGAVPRLRQEKTIKADAAAVASGPKQVTVVEARSAGDTDRVLPGTALPLLEAALYPRATGYIKQRLVDIGDHVEAGQLLAVIDAPDIDDHLAQARADLAQARANLERAKAEEEYARSDEQRSRTLVGTRAITQDDYEKSVRTFDAARASVIASQAAIQVNEAAVQRYTDVQGFERIVAPFAGVITARNIDQGDLVTADSARSTQELFHVMRTDTLRVWVNVPQPFATGIQVSQSAVVYQRDDPSHTFSGRVARTADALDTRTRTLLTEVHVPNPDNALRPGMYLQVKFIFRRQSAPVLVPSAALATRTGGPRLAVLDSDERVYYREVKLGRDFGKEVEVVAGLKVGDRVVVHPGDDLPEGQRVTPLAAK